MKFSPSVDARSFTYSIIVYIACDSYVKLTLPFTVCNLVAQLENSLNLGSQNDQISLIDKIKLKSTCDLSIYFIKFPALHKIPNKSIYIQNNGTQPLKISQTLQILNSKSMTYRRLRRTL